MVCERLSEYCTEVIGDDGMKDVGTVGLKVRRVQNRCGGEEDIAKEGGRVETYKKKKKS